jgi:hypothetical protein
LPFAAAVDSSGVVKELNSKGEAAFVAEAGDKARVWWNQSGNSEVAKMKPAWFEAAKKRAAAGGGTPREPAAMRLPPAPAVAHAAGPGGGAQDGAVLHFRGAL